MRETFPEIVEAGRLRAGAFGSVPGERQEAFELRHPRSGNVFIVIASNGSDWQACGLPGTPWEHVSVHLRGKDRCPSWAEMCWIKDLFWRPDECVMQLHVPAADHQNCHETTLPLWRPVGAEIPRPPRQCV